jgi:hypothetical protein
VGFGCAAGVFTLALVGLLGVAVPPEQALANSASAMVMFTRC